MSIERVRDYFRPLGREGDILEFPVSSATVELAAQAAEDFLHELGAIALVPVKLVLRVLLRRPDHPVVPAHLGQDGGRRDRR